MDDGAAACFTAPEDASGGIALAGLAVLAQRDSEGRWTRQVLGVGGDTWLDVSPDGVAYLSYLDCIQQP